MAAAGDQRRLRAQKLLNTMTNQTTVYARAPADSTRTAAGMLRTFMCQAAIASASPISPSEPRVT